jgi:hypothetical protein
MFWVRLRCVFRIWLWRILGIWSWRILGIGLARFLMRVLRILRLGSVLWVFRRLGGGLVSIVHWLRDVRLRGVHRVFGRRGGGFIPIVLGFIGRVTGLRSVDRSISSRSAIPLLISVVLSVRSCGGGGHKGQSVKLHDDGSGNERRILTMEVGEKDTKYETTEATVARELLLLIDR